MPTTEHWPRQPPAWRQAGSSHGAVTSAVAVSRAHRQKHGSPANRRAYHYRRGDRAIRSAHCGAALCRLQEILLRTDGCAATGAPDKNDWIIDRSDQAKLYPLVQDLISMVKALL